MPISDEIKIGDYVHASRWSDQSPNDPWCVGHVTEVGKNFDKPFVVVGKFSGRSWPNAVKITGEEGKRLLVERGAYTQEQVDGTDEDQA